MPKVRHYRLLGHLDTPNRNGYIKVRESPKDLPFFVFLGYFMSNSKNE